jgi:hypothetical protein
VRGVAALAGYFQDLLFQWKSRGKAWVAKFSPMAQAFPAEVAATPVSWPAMLNDVAAGAAAPAGCAAGRAGGHDQGGGGAAPDDK